MFVSPQIAMNILNSGRFSMGSACAGMIKKLIGIRMSMENKVVVVFFLIKQTGSCKINLALSYRDDCRICRHTETVH